MSNTAVNHEAKQKSRSVWGASPAGTLYGGDAAPGSREFFESVLARRNSHEVPWLYKVVPIASWSGLDVLEIGSGAGYDAFEMCRHGVRYTGIDITPENVERVKAHLGFYGYKPHVVEGDAESLPFPDAHFDRLYSFGVLHHTPNILQAFREAHRVLRPSGEFWVIVYHKNSIFYWLSLFLTEYFLNGQYRHQTFRERLSRLEYTTSSELPLVNVYIKREVKRLLKDAGLDPLGIWVRKLTSEDLPNIRLIHRAWKYIPQRLLDWLGYFWGWYVIARAQKKAS